MNILLNLADANPPSEASAKQFTMTLKGAMSYGTELGIDAFGNIARINNALADMPDRLQSTQVHLDNIIKQMENARQELQSPFPYEQELNEKSARLALLDAELNIGGQTFEVVDDAPATDIEPDVDDDFNDEERTNAKDAKPSILDSIKNIKEKLADKPDTGRDKNKSADVSIE